MVGSGTILSDDPFLTVRGKNKEILNQPLRGKKTNEKNSAKKSQRKKLTKKTDEKIRKFQEK